MPDVVGCRTRCPEQLSPAKASTNDMDTEE